MGNGNVTVTDRAVQKIAAILKREPQGAMLRVSVEGGGCSGFQYKFDVERERADDDIVLGNSDGSTLEPPISIPDDAIEVSVGRNGEVSVRQQGSNTLNTIGQIELARFVNPEGLKQIGKNLYIETDASGAPVTGTPQTDGMGAISQGQLEMSNVDPVRELIDLITTQRSFEMNSQVIDAGNTILQTITNLARR